MPQKILTVILGILILLGIVVLLVIAYFATHPVVNGPIPYAGGTPTQTTSNTGTQTTPAATQNPQITQYAGLFAALSAKQVTFARVSAATGTLGTLYALYAADLAQYKKMLPKNTDKSIGITTADLNGDGTLEGLVYEDLPVFCGSGGCNLDVYVKNGNSWVQVLDTLSGTTVGVGTTKTNGYDDLYITEQGSDTNDNAKVVKFTWDGAKYQPGPIVAVWNGSTFYTLK